MKTGYLSRLGVGCCVLAACGSQASPDYVGESLLTLSGRVEIADSQVEGTLRPALAFRSMRPEGPQLHFVDGATTGEFPSDFTLHVTEPPPQVVIDRARERHGSDPAFPPFPVAFMTAIGEDLPGTIDAEPSQRGSQRQPCNGASDLPCEVVKEWCIDSTGAHGDRRDEVCYSETRECGPRPLHFEDCALVSTKGNPDVREYPWQRLAGMSERLMIIWLEKALAADDQVAVDFDLPELAAGYHAFEVTSPSDKEQAAAEQCENDAYELSLAQYNEEHGTQWMLADLLYCQRGVAFYEECVEGELSEAGEGLFRHYDSSFEQLGCVRELQNEYRLLNADETAHISVRIAPDVRPLVDERERWRW
jgi:hypothetical protein